MDAVEFLDKVDRLSKRGSTEEKMRYNDYRTAGDNTWAVKFVEQWAAEHPVKTRQSVFLERWPEAFYSDGLLQICPACVSRSFRGRVDECVVEPKNCQKCKKDFWLAEVEDT